MLVKQKWTAPERRAPFLAGDWVVDAGLNALRKGSFEQHVEPKVMQVLLTLASRQNHVFSKEELISAVWADTFVSDDVLTRCISILRRITGDDAHAPRFIQTVPKVGYRLVAAVAELPPAAPEEPASPLPSSQVPEPPALASNPAPIGQGSRRTLWFAFFLSVTAALVGLTWFVLHARSSPADTHSGFRTVQFTSYAGEQTQPAFSPDGRRIAYVRIAEGGTSRRICVKQIGSESVMELTPPSDLEEQFSPAWSPDGRRIAYLARSKAGLGLYIAEAGANKRARRVFIPQEPSHWEQGALSWSPDGKTLIFPDHEGSQPSSSIFQLNLGSGAAHSLTSPPAGWEGDLTPAYSPDGRRIAFTRATETAVRDIYWIATTGGPLHQLTRDRMDIDSLAWSANGSAIVFSSNRGGKYALWKIALNASQPERLAVGTEDAFEPAVGPGPGQLAYAQGSAIWSIVRIEKERPAAPILSSTQQDSAPSLSPDGRSFAMQSLRSGSQEIWIAAIDGAMLRQLTFMGGPLTGSPSWSNRGDRILFDSRPDGHSHIFLVAAAGGQPRQLTFGNANDIVPRWSHDDQAVYFRSNRGGRWQLWKVAAAGGNPQPVTTGDGIEPQESADGKWLYYTRGDDEGIWRVSTAGGAETQILRQPSAGYWGFWQSTPRGIFYLDQAHSPASIRVFHPESKQDLTYATLSQAPPLYAGLSVAEQGRVVLTTEERDAGRHITLIEALR